MSRSIWTLSVVLALVLGLADHRVEGVCSVSNCTDRTRCVMSSDQRRCRCVSGYYDDMCDKDAHITVMCGRDYIAIRVVEDFFMYHNVPLESLHLPNKTCRAEREVIDSVPYYMSRLSKDDYLTCGGKLLVENVTHISYSLSLLSDPQVVGNIIREPIIKIDYKCVYPYVRTVSLPFPLIPFSSEKVVHFEEIDAKIQMMVYTDHTFTKAFSSAPTIELRDKVYVEVTVTEPADFFLLRLNDCWATQSSQPKSTNGLVHTLLQNGCANDQTMFFLSNGEEQSGHNGANSTIRFSFDMFRFTAEPNTLYLHCTIQLCEREDHTSCASNCNSISKREARRGDTIQGLLSYGPIRVEMPDRPQSSMLTVVLCVAGVWSVGFFLIITITVAKAGSRRLRQTEHRQPCCD